MGRYAQSRRRGGGGHRLGDETFEAPVVEDSWDAFDGDDIGAFQLTMTPTALARHLDLFVRVREHGNVPWVDLLSVTAAASQQVVTSFVGDNIDVQVAWRVGTAQVSPWSAYIAQTTTGG